MSSASFTEPCMPSRPAAALPPGTCDCHTHVFGYPELFPLRHEPDFPLPLAPRAANQQMRSLAGIDRAVLVQPAHYGFDHAALVDALRGDGQARGIGLADATVSDPELDGLNEAGVRGLRFTEFRNPDGSFRPGSVDIGQLPLLAPRMRELGWQAHVWAGSAFLAEFLARPLLTDIPIVIDHMGMPDLSAGVGDHTFHRLVSAVREGRVWVKLSLCRISTRLGQGDARAFHDALVEANPARLVWGSDWPFIRLFDRSPDVGELLDRFMGWVPDAELQRTILVDNPQTLFGFVEKDNKLV